jgi:WD40 repeat protein
LRAEKLKQLPAAVSGVAFGPRGPLAVSGLARSIAYSPAAGLVAIGRADGSVELQTAAGRRTFILRPGGAAVTAVGFSPDGELIATGSNDGSVQLWDVRERRRVRTLEGHTLGVTATVFSPDGTRLLTASLDKDVRLWSVERGELIHLLRWHFGPVLGASFSRDGRWVLTAGPGAAGVGVVATGQRVLFLRGHTGPLGGAAFAGDEGRLIVTVGRDGTIRRYRCDLCGDVDELIALAQQRLAS